MARFLKIAALLGIGLVLVFGALLFTFYRLVQIGEFRGFLISEVERQTRLKVRVGEARLRMGSMMGIAFRDFALLEPGDDQPVVEAQRILVRVALLPLLERRLVFDEIRLYQPRLRVARDEKGQFPLMELILSLPFKKQGDVRFDLDLRGIKIEKGEFLFLDQRQTGVAVTRLREADLELRRSRLNESLFSASGVPTEVSTEAARVLDFGLKTIVERNGQKVGLVSKGKMVLPKESLEPRQTWLDADIRVENLPTDLFQDYYGHLLPVRTIQGMLNTHIRWRGSLAQEGHTNWEIGFKRVELDAPDLFPNRLVPGDGKLELEADWSPKAIRITRFALRSQEISMAVEGSVRSLGEKGSDVALRLSTPFVPVVFARKYTPTPVLSSPTWSSWIGKLNQGEIKLTQVEISGPVSDLRRLFEPGAEGRLSLDAEVRDLGGNLGGSYLPLRGVSGRITLEKGVLYYKGFRGAYGQSRFVEVEGTHKDAAGQGSLELRARGEVDLGELREQLKQGFLSPLAAKVVNGLDEFSGKAKFGISLRKDSGSYEYNGQLSLDNARLRMGDLSFAQVRGELSLSPQEIRAEKLTALLAGSPIQARAVWKDYQSEKSAFDLTVESSGVRAGVVTRMLLSTGSLQDPGTVRGAIHYQGLLNSAGERRLSGSLELVGIQLPVKLFSQPLRDVAGKVDFDGKRIDFQALKGQVAGYGFNFSGQWRYAEKPQLVFTFNSPEMDLGRALSRQHLELDDWYDRLQARGKISIGKGRHEGFEFTDLKSDLTLDKRVWQMENLFARSAGGTVQGILSIIDSRDGFGLAAEPDIQGVPVQAVLRWFDVETKEITGNVHTTGKFESSGTSRAERRQNLSGDFHLEIRDGVLGRMPLLVRVLNLMDLTRWFSFQVPDFKQRGISFRSVNGDFKVKNGIYTTENLVVDSDDISITGAGHYDGPKDSIDAVVAMRPFPRVRSVVSYIPLIGPGIAAIKDSVMVASFHVEGPLEDPTVTPAPLSTLSEFFLGALKIPQKLITIPGTGQK